MIFLVNQGFALVHAPEWLYVFTRREFSEEIGLVLLLFRYHSPNPTCWVQYILRSPRDQVDMAMHNSLPCDSTDVYANVES